MERKDPKKKKGLYVIYVAGVPKKVSRQGLYEYFAKFGRISQITTAGSPNSVPMDKEEEFGQKGFCLISTTSWDTFSFILGYQAHVLLGRSIYCTKYQEGSSLMRQNRMNNQKKIIIRGIPPYLDMNSLKLLLEQTIGKVELMYQFKEISLPQDPSCRDPSKSFSVMFEEKSSAHHLLNLKQVSFNDSTLHVEKFRPASKRTKYYIPPHLTNPMVPIEIEKCDSLMNSTQGKSTGTDTSTFLGTPMDFVRPTTKMYHRLRTEQSNFIPPLPRNPLSLSNVRINQQQPFLHVALRPGYDL